MSENKFIKHLRGEQTAKSVLELKNQRTTTSFANMPEGTSNANEVYSDLRGNATAVLKGTDNWKLNGSSLVVPTDIYGDGRDVTGTYDVAGQTLWINASYTFPQAKIFTPNTKWVLKLCGNRLLSGGNDTIPLTLLIKFGATTIATKAFTIKEHAFNFAEELVVDFAESNANNIKVAANSTMTVQVLCGDATATAQIYNGMTVFTALQRRVDGDAVVSDKYTFDELSEDLATHIANKNNPHQVTKTQVGLGNCDNTSDLDKPISTATQNALDGKVSKSGDTMSGALNIANIESSNAALLTLTHSNTATYKWNIAPRYNSTTLSVYPGSTETNGFRFATTGFVPASNNARYLGSASLKWKGVYTGALNNGADLVVPNKAGTLATMGDVELAARSGTQLTDQGVWYAKMYAATVAPAAENGTNYADFSQVDGQGNPIIVTYNRVNGAWVQDQTITPPAEYDGYVIVTSKIWDIAEQTGQQGGRVLWNHTSKEFTPYPQIISFEDIEVTGNSTVDMPQNPGANQIVNKDYVDEAIASIPTVNNPTITITQGGVTKGSFTLNQASGDTIALDAGGTTTEQSIDAEIVGTLTITDNSVVSGFSKLNYLSLPGVFTLNDANSFEIKITFTTKSSVYSTQWIAISSKYNSGAGSCFMLSSGKVFVVLGSDIASQTVSGVTTLSASTKYYVKLSYDGARYTLSLSTDDVNYTQEAYVVATALPAPDTIYFGQGIQGTDTPSVIHMDSCYIKKNGIIIWQGMDAPGLHQRVAKGHEVIAFQAPTAGNNYTWYRKYADGWVEQGGTLQTAANSLTFPIEMADTNYQWYANAVPQDFGNFRKLAATRATTGLTGLNNLYGTSVAHASAAVWDAGTFWEIKGMAA